MKKRIDQVMTPQPWTVQVDDSLAIARRMMAEREVHHLPVLDAGAVVGMVTERDLVLAAEHVGPVADVMAPVHTVPPGTAIDDVLDVMATRRTDAVVVAADGHVAGIFTTTDAVRVLRDLIGGSLRASSRRVQSPA